jgi:hypothetical protein
LNPVPDTLRFWDGLERLFAKTIHPHRHPDTSVRGFGPSPAWLAEFRPQIARANNRLAALA